MASHVYYKFRAQISWDPISFDGHFVSVGELKRLICEKKSLGDAAAELVLSDPNNGSEYSDESAQIPKGTRVILRRVPPNRARVLVAATPLPQAPPPQTQAAIKPAGAAGGAAGAAASTGGDAAGDDFGADPFAQSAANLLQEQAAARSLALVAGAAPGPGKDRDRPGSWGLGGRGGPGASRGGGGRGRGPAVSYICRRCGEQGKHWEKECSTVGDPAYDYKTVRMPTGIPVTKLQRNTDGSLYLPTGELGELAPNQAAFRKELALMTGAAAALQAEVAEPASSLALVPAAAPHPAVKAEAAEELPETNPTGHTPSAREGASKEIKPEQPAGQREADLFDDDEPEQHAAPIPLISLGAEREQPTASPMHTNGNADTTAQDAAKLWDTYHAVKEDLPRGTTLKMWVEAFGAGRPLTAAEFKRFQLEHKSAAAKAGKPSRQSQEREQQHGIRASSREPDSPTHALDQRRRMRSRSRSRSRTRSRSRSRSRSRGRGRDKRSPVSWRSRGARRTPSVPRENDEEPSKARADGERRLAKAAAPDKVRGSRTVEEKPARLPVKEADDDDVESAGRKRPRSSSEELSERKERDQDRYRHEEPEDQKQSRSSPDAVAERLSSDSGRGVADEGTSREGEQQKHGDSKKSKKKHRKEHKKRKDKHHKKEHKSRRRSRSSSPPVERGRSVDNPNDRYIPSDYNAPSRDDDDRDGEVASSRRRRKASRDGRKREDHSEERAADRGAKKPERPVVPGPGNLFQRALTSVERSISARR